MVAAGACRTCLADVVELNTASAISSM
jgi:hypothetical protein